ncbi:MAG: TetR/AcrR family transcriptional regulator [Chitinophagales bacterium]|nr:TetR/AcrR family transcriptional regulator [Chitinophagales bacterium]
MEVKTDKREEIMNVAEQLFAQHGFDAVSIRAISKAADINIAMISYYFGSKESLYEEVISRKLVSTDLLIKTVNQYENSKEALFSIVDLFIDRFFANREFQNIIFREIALSQRKEMPEFITKKVHQNFSIVYDLIEKGIQQKIFKPVDIELTVIAILGIIRSYTTSGNIVCKVMNTKTSETFNNKNKERLKNFIKELLTTHLDIK